MSTPLGSHALVSIQFASIVCAAIPFAGNQGSPWWLAVTALGTLVGVFTLLHNRPGNFGVYPEPLGHAELVTSGPYQWVRHPMYLAVLLFMLGIGMFNGSPLNQLALLGLLFAIVGKMNKEEAYLREHFNGYTDYCANNKRLVPFIY